jgi:HK97 gp10 family phage protein
MPDVTWEKLIVDVTGAEFVIRGLLYEQLKSAAKKVQSDAKKKFGTYQPGIGPFPAWAVLNYDYVVEKVANGAPGDAPLIGYYSDRARRDSVAGSEVRLKDSIGITMNADEPAAYIGTNNLLGVFHEYGTIKMPPRPFLRPALYQNEKSIIESMKEAIAGGLVSYFK